MRQSLSFLRVETLPVDSRDGTQPFRNLGQPLSIYQAALTSSPIHSRNVPVGSVRKCPHKMSFFFFFLGSRCPLRSPALRSGYRPCTPQAGDPLCSFGSDFLDLGCPVGTVHIYDSREHAGQTADVIGSSN